MKIYIKNMVCKRCKMLVKSELEKLNIPYITIELGEINTYENVTSDELELLDAALKQSGLELIHSRKDILVERIKNSIIELVHESDEVMKANLSDYLSEKLKYDYTYLANIFSKVMGTTIDKFFIAHKIERVKELLFLNEFSLKEISFITRYSSVSHLSNQFKKVTGLAPTQFKKLQYKNIISIEQIFCN